MTARRATITQTALTRYLKAYRDAGYPVARTEISRDGKVVIFTNDSTASEDANPWDAG
ncbi:hypothetical protein [Roseovarius indicus]|uniref:Uncharacterized protein n=1 Tax=Roseovarius indicus TaxID=540747 RepID=A0A5P3AIM9_9RHOB|nr:hypothetical protein [Roseovarius indicus]QEW28198.1 hypothetical protein RIdsm_04025 [Roseovarius indicus]SFE56197.1 hypothetical protein SAMN04488031_112126 [Roseovarius indicus]